ncbi:MAG: hypothetical protein P9E24_01520 [Candidatus Competibacter sp.]|nr:hypothetical protein [Candidatus Competibacter sp.]MDG4585738.1 hypothetical protein [Candidatus Competibacter sp.]
MLRSPVRPIIEEALEAEVTDVLGRGYHARGEHWLGAGTVTP